MKKQRRSKRSTGKSSSQSRVYGFGVVLIVSIVLFGFYRAGNRSPSETVTEQRLSDNPGKGASDAAVTIVEFGDFGCTACKAWYQAGILDQILLQYGDKVRLEWRDFPIITPYSPKAAEAGQCAYDQGKFWEFHDITFERAPALRVNDLQANAAEIGLDVDAFSQCLDSAKHQSTVDLDLQQAYGLGLRGTPSFTINGEPIIGPTPERMVALIDAALAATEATP
ncbi:MAG: hypothetical protein DWQ07_18115 [Chloroflexi bacterium]|nr:MAG: hypothetical protein DWQ07_18115 [Chloroflexota bacterium]